MIIHTHRGYAEPKNPLRVSVNYYNIIHTHTYDANTPICIPMYIVHTCIRRKKDRDRV